MANYTPEQLRKEFIAPLIKAARRINRAARRLEQLIIEEKCPFDYAPMHGVMAERAIKELIKFSRHTNERVAGIAEGTYRFQEATKQKLREKYQATKKAVKKKNGTENKKSS
jgi:sugar-specific transcriptional regulator TrmB